MMLMLMFGSAFVITSCGDDDPTDDMGKLPKGVEAVDLGLPSGVKWANMNVGATTPEDFGDYFAWGETEPKSDYSLSTYFESKFDKYATDKKTQLDPEDDVVHVKWGGDWRMPTKSEQDELRGKCSWKWTSMGGVDGCIVTGPNGNSIFLPAAGYRYNDSLYVAGSNGYYWSSSLYGDASDYACSLGFFLSGADWSYYYRYGGLAIRAVCP